MAHSDVEAVPRTADPEPRSGHVAALSGRLRRHLLSEEADDYPRVVLVAGHQRVIECRHRIQWILQRRSGDKWSGRSYCRQRASLLRLCSDWSDDALDVLRALPEWIEEAG